MHRTVAALVAALAAGPALAQSDAQAFMSNLGQSCLRQATSPQGISHAQWQVCSKMFPELKAMKDRQDAEDRAKRQAVPRPRPRPTG